MRCPNCQCDEISAMGMCLWCGHQVTGPDAEPGPVATTGDGSDKAGFPNNPDEPGREELPQWRRELSQRLRSIKKKREASRMQAQAQAKAKSDAAAAVLETLDTPLGEPVVDAERAPRPRTQPRNRRKTNANKETQVEASAVPAPETELKSFSEPEAPPADPMLKPIDLDSDDGTESFNDLFFRQFSRTEKPGGESEGNLEPEASVARNEGSGLLAYRSLSGFVDLSIMALSTALLVIAAGLFSGVRLLAPGNAVPFALLFLLVYSVYSLLFLGLSNQTIGMMWMNLQVVDRDGKRVRISRMLARSCAFLISFACVCLGLIWAFFDRDRQCFHDRITATRVVRLGSRD